MRLKITSPTVMLKMYAIVRKGSIGRLKTVKTSSGNVSSIVVSSSGIFWKMLRLLADSPLIVMLLSAII